MDVWNVVIRKTTGGVGDSFGGCVMQKKNFVMRKVLLFFYLLGRCWLIILFSRNISVLLNCVFSKFPHTQNIIQIRVSDASHLQHAYEIKDFGSTMFQC